RLRYADTGELRRGGLSPFQSPRDSAIGVSTSDGGGDGGPAAAVGTARRGRGAFRRGLPGWPPGPGCGTGLVRRMFNSSEVAGGDKEGQQGTFILFASRIR